MAKKQVSVAQDVYLPADHIERSILMIRGERVMLDADLAELYGVETRALIQAVKRNIERFPLDFAFELTPEEFNILRSQFVISRWGGRRYPPYAFTEHGIAMLSSVLRSPRAVRANIEIMRTFIRLRRMLALPSGPRQATERAGATIRRPVQGRLRCHPRTNDRAGQATSLDRVSRRGGATRYRLRRPRPRRRAYHDHAGSTSSGRDPRVSNSLGRPPVVAQIDERSDPRCHRTVVS